MAEFSYLELQKCAEREVAMRKNVFKKRGMTPDREREIAMMEQIAAHFQELIRMGVFIGTGQWPEK